MSDPIFMDTGQVVAAGGKLTSVASTLGSATKISALGGAADYPTITGAVSGFHGKWDTVMSQIVSSLTNLGGMTKTIGSAVAADDTHRANIFRVGKDQSWDWYQPNAQCRPGPAPTPTPTPTPVPGPHPTPTPPAPPAPPAPIRYAPTDGENLTRISEHYNVPVEDLVKANHIQDPNLIQRGEPLIIPPPNGPAPHPRSYAPEPGENLTWISQRYGVPVEDIVKANHIPDPNVIHPGQPLVIPPPPGAPSKGHAIPAQPHNQP